MYIMKVTVQLQHGQLPNTMKEKLLNWRDLLSICIVTFDSHKVEQIMARAGKMYSIKPPEIRHSDGSVMCLEIFTNRYRN